jgi:high-affinity nickel permease
VVIIVTIIVAATSAALAERFDKFQTVGGIIGVAVSCGYTSTPSFIADLITVFFLLSQ